jgi:hypothetical protein
MQTDVLPSYSDPAGYFGGSVGLVIALFLLILAILWFCLPFAIFGIKRKLDALIEQQKKSNDALDRIARIQDEMSRTRL